MFVLEKMFISRHYAGEDQAVKFDDQEYWKKVFGPVYIYLNSHASAKTSPSVLWNDAKNRVMCLFITSIYRGMHTKY